MQIDPRPCPADEAALRESAALCRGAIQRLPAHYREVLELRLGRGMTIAEIAGALGRPAGTIRTWLWRGLDCLRRGRGLGAHGGLPPG